MAEGLWRTSAVPADFAQALATRHRLPVRVARWLSIRGITNEQEVVQWLEPPTEFLSPWLFSGMKAAVTRILTAVTARERICVVGDYDVDGVTASTIVASTLAHLGADWICLIPHRVEDGYGLSSALVDRALEQGAQLIITVDNGIAAAAALDYAQSRGIDVVVTDHHEPPEQLPAHLSALVHWCQAQDRAVDQLSGAGVAWKLAQALLAEATVNGPGTTELQEWHIGLAALGALADVMPMKTENRSLVRKGLEALQRTPRAGWAALCEAAGVDPGRLNDRTVLWSLTPRLNAAGRMGSAQVAFELLMANQAAHARSIAMQIEMWNDERKRETARAVEEAVQICQAESTTDVAPAIAVAGPWPLGVVGIVAAKLVERFDCPVVVFADDGSSVLKGSGRAPEGFSLHEAMECCADHLVHFGGHQAAVGCAIEPHKLDDFKRAFAQAAGVTSTSPSESVEIAVADDYLPLSEATMEMVTWLDRFAPYGPGNPEFNFFLGPLQLVSVTRMGKGNHLRLRVREGNDEVDLVWFQAPEEAAQWAAGQQMSAVVYLERNEFRGTVRVQLRVKEAHLLQDVVSREDFSFLYRLLRTRRTLLASEGLSALPEPRQEKAQLILDTFVELGFAEWDRSAYHVVEQVVARDLRDSHHYQRHLRRAMG